MSIVSRKLYLSPKLRKMREDGLSSLYYFTTEILGYGKAPFNLTSQIHRDMCAWLEGVFGGDQMFHLMLDFRGCGKSLLGGAGHFLWRGVRNPNITAKYTHADEGMANEVMSQIRSHLEHNEILRALYEPEVTPPPAFDQRFAKKNSDSQVILGRTFAPKTASLRMLGYKTGRTGAHVDLMILDDLVNEHTSTTRLLMEGVKAFVQQVPPLLHDQTGRKSKVLCLGTRWDIDDAWGMLDDEGGPYQKSVRKWVYSCYADPEEKVSRWPEKYSVEDLQKLEVEMTTPKFSANYRNEPVPRGMQKFDVQKVKRYDLKLDGQNRPILPTGNPYLVYTAVDPNRKDDGQGDPAAVLTVARDCEGNHFVLDLEYGRPNSIEMVLWIRQAWEKWKAIAVFYEAICGQEMLIPWLKKDMVESGVAYPLTKSSRRMGAAKIVRILGLSHVIETGRLWVPNSVRFKPLLREIELYTGQNKFPKDDCLDCLADIYADGFDSTDKGRRDRERRVPVNEAAPWQTSLLDTMIGTWGGRMPRVRSVESMPRWR